MPRFSSRSRTSAIAMTLFTAALIFPTTAAGVPAGASKPNHYSNVKPGTPASIMVGICGNKLERFLAVMPMTRNFGLLK